MGNVSSPHEAWELVQKAAADGVFVPVIGLEMSANPDYGKASPRVADAYGQDPDGPMSSQDTELAGVWSHQCRLAAQVSAEEPSGSAKAYWPLLPAFPDAALPLATSAGMPHKPEVGRIALAAFIKSMSWPGRGGMYCNAEEAAEQTAEDVVYEDLIADAALLAMTMKRAWSTWLADDSEPFSSVNSDSPIGKDYPQDEGVHYVLCACLEHCWDLLAASRSKRWTEPHDLLLRSIYSKLLLLGSQVLGGEPNLIWKVAPDGFGIEPSDFIGRHGETIRSYGADATGWRWSGSGLPQSRSISHGVDYGLRLPHVLWTESLVRHLFLAGTRAYRTASQIAFLLALDDEGGELPNMSGDPFEVGLLHEANTGRDIAALRSLLDFAETVLDAEGVLRPRPPGAFHRALAKVIARMLEVGGTRQASVAASKRKTGATSAGQAAVKAILLTMALDREMERAFELELDSYRLLIPVWLPLKSANPRERRSEAAWMLGEFEVVVDDATHARISVCRGWINVTTLDADARLKANVLGRGPLLIKLFGSPLTDVGSCEDYVSSCEIIDVRSEIQPRVVLDERELLRLLSESIPAQVQALHDALLNAHFFFFGQNAVSWSDRIPYLMIDAIRRQGAAVQAGTDADDGASRRESPGETALAVAFAHRSEYGDSLFDRLKIKGNDVDEAAVLDVALAIMRGIIDEGI